MILPPLSRRLLLYSAFLLLAAFLLILVHALIFGGIPSVVTGIGAGAAALVVILSVNSMKKMDDYLTPRHTLAFFIGTSLLTFTLAGLLIGFLVANEFPPEMLQVFGGGAAATAIAYSIFAFLRIREASMLPKIYRPEEGILKNTLLPVAVSIIAFAIGAISLHLSIPTKTQEPVNGITSVTKPADEPRTTTEPEPESTETTGTETTDDGRKENTTMRADEVFAAAREALKEGRYRSALNSFQRAAELRHPDAFYELSLLYMEPGYLHDPGKADENLQKAVQNGHTEAIARLAEARRFGRFGYRKDPLEARRLFDIAAEKNHPKSQSQLAHMLANGEGGPVDNARALYWFKRAASLGDKVAQNDIGIFYLQGKGTEADPAKGIEWLTKAAEQGVAVAEYNLAQAYYSGDFVEQDHKQAKIYFERLAAKNIPYGFQMLGLQYLQGEGSAKNETAAFDSFTEGATRGDTISQYYLGYCYLEGIGTGKNSTAAIHYLTAAAKKQHAGAQLVLGNIHREGNVILTDKIEAAKWYQLSATNGSAEAESLLEELNRELSEEEIAESKQRTKIFMRENQS